MVEATKDQSKKKTTPRGPRKSSQQLWKLIINVIKLSNARKGTSVVAIKKGLRGQGVDVKKNNARINRSIIKLRDKGVLVQSTGVGASGSFKLAKTKVPATKPKPRKTGKPAVKKPKRPGAKKTAGAKVGKKSTGGKKAGGAKKSTTGKTARKANTKTKDKKVDKKKKKNTKSAKRNSPKKSTKRTPVKRPNAKKSGPRTPRTKKSKK